MPGNEPDGRRRIAIETVSPQIDCGRFPIKRVVGETVVVEADMFADGHDRVACRVLYWQENANDIHSSAMEPIGNDRWRAEFSVLNLGRYRYTVEGWVDHFETWRTDLIKRIADSQDVAVELQIGVALIKDAATRAAKSDAELLLQWSLRLTASPDRETQRQVALDPELHALMLRYPDQFLITRYDKELPVIVDREKARFATWYEIFPRSCSAVAGQHGTLKDCEARLPYIASMGFDVIYLPPVSPIGHTFRKGQNNATRAKKGDVGTPWAVGSEDGGHTAIHPQLGTLEDFRHFVAASKDHGLEVALDIAFQCTPDHPYVREHREWFRARPDGTIQYAENPPKKYQDIYPFDFENSDWRALWAELKSIFIFWIDQGVRIFRVDNPHTKPFSFWEWVITEITAQYPDVLFLSEAFTRPAVTHRLAKLGFSQSYTYFSWRNTKQELTQYFTELTTTDLSEYFRPSLWPNTPDILPEFLQSGGRPAFMIRLILAATLGSSYGIYGPAFELGESAPSQPGSEEYLNSEKYELKYRDLNSPWSLKDFIAKINRIRKNNTALQRNRNLRFHETNNPSIICFSKSTDDQTNTIIVLVNLDSFNRQIAWVTLDLDLLGIDPNREYQVHDLLGEGSYTWRGSRNYVELTPESLPAHILLVRRKVRTERNFDQF
jgi:starch synthase (maltosyl-transferring)